MLPNERRGQHPMLANARRGVWQQLAAGIGGHFDEGGILGRDTVYATHKIWTIRLESYTQPSAGAIEADYTQLTTPFESADGVSWSVRNHDWGTRIGRLPGLKQIVTLLSPPEIETGDPNFDRRFLTNGSNSEKVTALFAKPEIRSLMFRQPKINLDAKRRGRKSGPTEFRLGFQERGTILNLDRLRGLFQLFVVTLDQMVEIGSARDETT